MLILNMCLFFTNYSQTSIYKPFCDNPSWTSVTTNFLGSSYNNLQYELDTVISGNTYKKIRGINNTSYYVLFREDISQKKIYRYDRVHSSEFLYINFNLAVGDSFDICLGDVTVIDTKTVTVKDSMLINGVYHNYIDFKLNLYGGYKFIEGILSDRNPLTAYYDSGDPVYNLACICKAGIPYYQPLPTHCQISCLPTKIDEKIEFNDKSQIYPVPSFDKIYLSNSLLLHNATYEILDNVGGKIVTGLYNSSEGINIKQFVNGIYLLKIKSGQYKFIKTE